VDGTGRSAIKFATRSNADSPANCSSHSEQGEKTEHWVFSFFLFELSQRSHNCVNAKVQIIFLFQFRLKKLCLRTAITRSAKAVTDQQLTSTKIRTVNLTNNLRALLLKG